MHSTQLNGMQEYIQSEGTSRDESVLLLTEESLTIAQSVLEISATLLAKNRILAALKSREEIIKQQEADAEARLKIETKKINNRNAVSLAQVKKQKDVRIEADLIKSWKTELYHQLSKFINTSFYAINANTLTFKTKISI